MTPRRTGDIPTTKPSPYRLPLLLGAAGVILLVLGFSIPGWGWLAWLGFLLLLVAALSYRWWFWFSAADWRLVEKDRSNKDDGPPPPSGDERS